MGALSEVRMTAVCLTTLFKLRDKMGKSVEFESEQNTWVDIPR